MTIDLFEQSGALRKEKPAEALAILEKALRLREEVYGADDVYLGTNGLNLGLLYWHFGRQTDAARQYQRTIDLYRRILGDGNMPDDYPALLHASGLLHLDRGDYAKALPQFLTARRIYRTNKGDADPLAIELTDVAAFTLIELGEFDQAETLLKEGMVIQERSGGTKTLAYARALRCLARLRMRTNDRAEGWKLFNKAESTLVELAKSDLPSVIPHHMLHQIEWAEYLCEQGNYADALPHLTWALDAFIKAPANMHLMGRYYTNCLRFLGIAYTETFDYDRGEKNFRDAITELRKKFGPELAPYRIELTSLGQVMEYKSAKAYREGKLDLYATERKRIVEMNTEFAGTGHALTRIAWADLATAERLVKLDAPGTKAVGRESSRGQSSACSQQRAENRRGPDPGRPSSDDNPRTSRCGQRLLSR